MSFYIFEHENRQSAIWIDVVVKLPLKTQVLWIYKQKSQHHNILRISCTRIQQLALNCTILQQKNLCSSLQKSQPNIPVESIKTTTEKNDLAEEVIYIAFVFGFTYFRSETSSFKLIIFHSVNHASCCSAVPD